jgi:hypothetical protein
MPDPGELLSFLEYQRRKQAELHPGFGRDKITCFMGTSAAPGRPPSLFARRLELVETDPGRGALTVRVRGALRRQPEAGENVAVTLVDVPGYRGFQLKSPTCSAARPAGIEAAGADARSTAITCAHVYTVRAEPSAASFFERVPHAEVEGVARAVRFALLAVGAQANVSPRFVYGWELAGDGVALFHGDAFLNKTFYNVQRNRIETRLVLDLDDFSGYELQARVEEADPRRHAAVVERISSCFAAAGFRANRIYRSVATTWKSVAPGA